MKIQRNLDSTFKQDILEYRICSNESWVAEEDFWKSKHVLRRFISN